MKIFYLTAVFVFLITPITQAGGDRIQNGGDGCVVQFKAIGKNILKEVEKNPAITQLMNGKLQLFAEKVFQANIEVTELDEKIIDPVTGFSVQAANDGENYIRVSRSLWCNQPTRQQTIVLVFHEYLGLVGLEKSQQSNISEKLFDFLKTDADSFILKLVTKKYPAKESYQSSCDGWFFGKDSKKLIERAKKRALSACKIENDVCLIDEDSVILNIEEPCTVEALAVGYSSSDPEYQIIQAQTEFESYYYSIPATGGGEGVHDIFLSACKAMRDVYQIKVAQTCFKRGMHLCASYTDNFLVTKTIDTTYSCSFVAYATGLVHEPRARTINRE